MKIAVKVIFLKENHRLKQKIKELIEKFITTHYYHFEFFLLNS